MSGVEREAPDLIQSSADDFAALRMLLQRLLLRLSRSGVESIASEVHPPSSDSDCECEHPAMGTIAFGSPLELIQAHVAILVVTGARSVLYAEPLNGNYWLSFSLSDLDVSVLSVDVLELQRTQQGIFDEVFAHDVSEASVDACGEVEGDGESFAHHPTVRTSRGIDADVKVAPLLEKLWRVGVTTLCSCGGDENLLPIVSIDGLVDSLRAFAVAIEAVDSEWLSLEHCGDEGHGAGRIEYDLVLDSAELKTV